MRFIKRLGGPYCGVPGKKANVYKTKQNASVGDIVVEGNLIVSKENYSKQDKEAIGIVYMTTQLTGDDKIRYVSLDYMSTYNPTEGISDISNAEDNDMWPVFGGYLFDQSQAPGEYDGGDWDVDGYAYPYYDELINAGWKVYDKYPIASDKIHVSGTHDTTNAPSVDNGNIAGPEEASIFKYKSDVKLIPVPYFNNGEINPEFRTNSYAVSGTSTVVEFNNPLSDIDGKVNCDIILDLIKTADGNDTTLITDNAIGYEFPAVMCCHLYNKGNVEWYLPAMGELAYIYVNIKLINETRNTLGLDNFNSVGSYFLSSSLLGKDMFGSEIVGILNINNGSCSNIASYNAGGGALASSLI